MKPEIQEFLDRITPEDRINLMVGLERKHQRETAMLVVPVADLLAAQLKTLGLKQDAEYIDNLVARLHYLI